MSKEQKENTFLEGDWERDSGISIVADEILTGMPNAQKLGIFKGLLSQVADLHNDEAALFILELIQKTDQGIEANLAQKYLGSDKHQPPQACGLQTRAFRDWLMKIWWELPWYEEVENLSHLTEYLSTLSKSKEWILKEIVQGWRPEPLSESGKEMSDKALRFLIMAYDPQSISMTDDDMLQGFEDVKEWILTRWLDLSLGRKKVQESEQNKILKATVGPDAEFSVKELERMIQVPRIPHDFAKSLAKARTRKGGLELCLEDIHNAELVKSLSPDERSPAAIELGVCAKTLPE